MRNVYDEVYNAEGYYWGTLPSPTCFQILEHMPPDRPLKLLDIGCGEGRNAVFFARNGYHVTGFDISPAGVKKTLRLAEGAGAAMMAFVADLLEHRLEESYDILYSLGTLHLLPSELRDEVMANYRKQTNANGLHLFEVFVDKPFLATAPDMEPTADLWKSGELLSYYHDWRVESFVEEIFDCPSSGVPHQHAVNRIIARQV